MHLKQWLREKKLAERAKGNKYYDKDFARKIGVSCTTISNWIAGRSVPIKCIAKVIERETKHAVKYEDFLRQHEKKNDGEEV